MERFEDYANLSLRGGFQIRRVRVAAEPMTDALGRPATARTWIIALNFFIELAPELSPEEISLSLYHEVLEAATVAAPFPPPAVVELNEADFEEAARRMHDQLGPVTPFTLDRMLKVFGF